MDCVRAALTAEFRKLNFTLNQLLVLARVIIRVLTLYATQFDQIFGKFGVGHGDSE